MAHEIQVRHATGSTTLYAVIVSPVGTVWDGTSLVAPAGATWTGLDVPLTEQGGKGLYTADFPAVAAGLYSVLVYDRVGGSPAATDTPVAEGPIPWTGSAVEVPVTAAGLADAVWDGAPAGTPVADIAEAVWAGAPAGTPLTDIADAVWDEARTGHTTAGTFGFYLDASVSGVSTGGVSVEDIAAAVWDGAPAGTPLADIAEAVHAVNNIVLASVVDDTTPTTTEFTGPTSLPATDGFYSNPPCMLAFTSGPLLGLARRVTGYTGSTRTFTFESAWPVAPANTTPFILFGVIED